MKKTIFGFAMLCASTMFVSCGNSCTCATTDADSVVDSTLVDSVDSVSADSVVADSVSK